MKMTLKLRDKLILITIGTVFLMVGLNTYWNTSDFIRIYKQRTIERIFIQIQPLKEITEDILDLGLDLADIGEIDRECRNLVNSVNNALYCFVTDNHGKVYYHSSPDQVGAVYSDPATQAALESPTKQSQVIQLSSGDKAYDLSLPLERAGSERVGLIRFGVQYRIIDDEISRLVNRAIILGIISLFCAGLIVFFLSEYSILRPVRKLMEGITRFGKGELDSRVKVKTKDEIGELAKAYNNMAQSILLYIDERKQTEQKLEQYAAELKSANDEVKRFTYTVSHDLRAPLLNIRGFSEEFKRSVREGKEFLTKYVSVFNEEDKKTYSMIFEHDMEESVEFISASVSRMNLLIESILKLSRLGRSELKPEPVQTGQLVQSLLKTLAHQIENHRARIQVGILPDLVIDREAIERIFGNLLDNAVKYLDHSRPGVIEISAEQDSEGIVFTIRDNGRGIAPDDVNLVFDPFRRAGSQDVPGEGMGLAYVKTLVKHLGGRIWCKSELGKETTFSFTIPMTPTSIP